MATCGRWCGIRRGKGSPSLDRTERFYRIELLIRTRGCVSFADLMGELGVSRATLKRDLEYLRARMDAPIVYDRFARRLRRDPARAGARLVQARLEKAVTRYNA